MIPLIALTVARLQGHVITMAPFVETWTWMVFVGGVGTVVLSAVVLLRGRQMPIRTREAGVPEGGR
jgi:hypothetical protein